MLAAVTRIPDRFTDMKTDGHTDGHLETKQNSNKYSKEPTNSYINGRTAERTDKVIFKGYFASWIGQGGKRS